MAGIFDFEQQMKNDPKNKELRAKIMEKLKRKGFTDVSITPDGRLVGTSYLKGMKTK